MGDQGVMNYGLYKRILYNARDAHSWASLSYTSIYGDSYLIKSNILRLLTLFQMLLAIRVISRFIHSTGGKPIRSEEARYASKERVAIIVPVLNEVQRLSACLDGLIAQGSEVTEILVVDGGSHDGTQNLVISYSHKDSRIRLVDASPVPSTWNGKAWGLHVGLQSLHTDAAWVLTIDADVRPHVPLVKALLGRAKSEGLDALSVATMQELDGVGEGLLHPSLLTTLVYRFGIPNKLFQHVNEVQANGQCFLFRCDVLYAIDGFTPVKTSICEDVTIARLMVSEGYCVGFYEAGSLVRVKMYENWHEMWFNWPRSLMMHDRFSGLHTLIGWLEVLFVQALPLPLLIFLLLMRKMPGRNKFVPYILNGILIAMRIGVLSGTARTYEKRPWSYWLSPLCDVPVTLWLGKMALQRRHTWRGRVLVRDDDFLQPESRSM